MERKKIPKTKPRTKINTLNGRNFHNPAEPRNFCISRTETFADDEYRKLSQVASFGKFREYKLSLATSFYGVEIKQKKMSFYVTLNPNNFNAFVIHLITLKINFFHNIIINV